MLLPGAVNARPPRGRAQSHAGVKPLSPLADTHFEPLPRPLGLPPYRFDLETAAQGVGAASKKAGRFVFHTVGDTGGIKNGDFQAMVATQMKTDLVELPEGHRPSLFFHLGDVVYYNGEISQYYDQFYEPYNHYTPPIIGIAGNHDGDPINASQQSLDGWVRYFMTPQPSVDPISGDAPRVTLSLPNVYFTLICPFVTIVAMYTNVPEGGSVDSVQQQWLTNEFKAAPEDKALIVALHHPIYSFDDHHSGSPAMADVVQHAINESRRVPNMVLTAHVHNYQRIHRDIVEGHPTPFVVAGHGGYYHRHGMTADVGQVDESVGAELMFHDQFHHGYVTVEVDTKDIHLRMTPIAESGSSKHKDDAVPDAFSYSAAPLYLPANVTVSL